MDYVEPYRVELDLRGANRSSLYAHQIRARALDWCRNNIGKPFGLPTWRVDLTCMVFDNPSDAMHFKLGFTND